MKDYVCILSTKPAVRLRKEIGVIVFKVHPDLELKIYKLLDKYDGESIESGLGFMIKLKANNLDEAMQYANMYVDGIVSFITLTSGISITRPKIDIAYDASRGIRERDFSRSFIQPELNISKGRLNDIDFSNIIDKFYKLSQAQQWIIGTAIRWYRLGCSNNDLLMKFSCFWIGLEALNPLLQEKFNVKSDPTTCPKCGHQWKTTETISGIREFIKTFPEKKKDYQRIHKLRINTLHAIEPASKLIPEAIELNPILIEILFRAIMSFLIDDWKKATFSPPIDSVPVKMELIGSIIGDDPEKLGQEGKYPDLEPTKLRMSLKNVGDDVVAEFSCDFDVKAAPGVTFSLKEQRLYGSKGSKGSFKPPSTKN